ncbi:MAG: DEAD/DEAH box helicase [Cytophagales bacterium]
MNTFDAFALPSSLLDRLAAISYNTPTPIQAKTIPIGISGRDILGTSRTGSGKTAAFIIPLIVHLINHPGDRALVLAPTRELALQIARFAHSLLPKESRIYSVSLIGGQFIGRQIDQLRRNPALVVATPGRLCDHLDRGTIKVDNVRFLVLDEADCMLNIGFSQQLNRIADALPKQRQTLMFSATMEKNIIALAQTYLSNPERVEVGSVKAATTNVHQKAIFTTRGDKYGELLKALQERQGSIIIFAKTRVSTEKLCYKLEADGEKAIFLNGGLSQSKRGRVVRIFKEGKKRILVATDVAARGIDIQNIAHVINYDLPQSPEDYIHRVGRTGRAGASGAALSLITSDDYPLLHAMKKELDLKIEGIEQMPEMPMPKRGRRRGNSNSNSGWKSGGRSRSRWKRNDKPFKRY